MESKLVNIICLFDTNPSMAQEEFNKMTLTDQAYLLAALKRECRFDPDLQPILLSFVK